MQARSKLIQNKLIELPLVKLWPNVGIRRAKNWWLVKLSWLHAKDRTNKQTKRHDASRHIKLIWIINCTLNEFLRLIWGNSSMGDLDGSVDTNNEDGSIGAWGGDVDGGGGGREVQCHVDRKQGSGSPCLRTVSHAYRLPPSALSWILERLYADFQCIAMMKMLHCWPRLRIEGWQSRIHTVSLAWFEHLFLMMFPLAIMIISFDEDLCSNLLVLRLVMWWTKLMCQNMMKHLMMKQVIENKGQTVMPSLRSLAYGGRLCTRRKIIAHGIFFIFSHENENRHGFQKIKIFVKGPIKPLGKLFRTPNFVFLSELQELEVRAKFPIMGKWMKNVKMNEKRLQPKSRIWWTN